MQPAMHRALRYGHTQLLSQLTAQCCARLEDIASLSDENKKFVLNMIDMAIRGILDGTITYQTYDPTQAQFVDARER